MLLDMIQRTKGFLADDYDRIMKEIKHKINVYLQIAVGRAGFFREPGNGYPGKCGADLSMCLHQSMTETGWKSELPEEMAGLFLLTRNEFIDTGSIRFREGHRASGKEPYERWRSCRRRI